MAQVIIFNKTTGRPSVIDSSQMGSISSGIYSIPGDGDYNQMAKNAGVNVSGQNSGASSGYVPQSPASPAASGPYSGMPTKPSFEPAIDGSGGLKPVYRVNPEQVSQPGTVGFQSILPTIAKSLQNVQPNTEALNTIRQQALSNTASPWLQLQMKRQQIDELANQEQNLEKNRGNQAAAESDLAMRGGLQSGARERLAKSSALQSAMTAQDVKRAGATERLGLQSTDATNKQNLLQSLPGMELQYEAPELQKANTLAGIAGDEQSKGLAAQQQNIANSQANQQFNVTNDLNSQKYNSAQALSDLLQKRGFDLGNYGEAMKAWAAGKSSDAIAGSGKK